SSDLTLCKPALQIFPAGECRKFKPTKYEKGQIPILIAQGIIETSCPFRGGMANDLPVKVSINPVVAIQICHAHVAWFERMSIRVEFFDFSEVLRRILPNPYLLIVVIDGQPLTDKPTIVDIVHFSICQFDNSVIASSEIQI